MRPTTAETSVIRYQEQSNTRDDSSSRDARNSSEFINSSEDSKIRDAVNISHTKQQQEVHKFREPTTQENRTTVWLTRQR